MKLRRVLLSAFLVTITSAAVSRPAQAQGLVLYDDFRGGRIDPDKWLTSQSGNHVEELVRRIDITGALTLATVVYGSTSSNVGTGFDGSFLNFSNPNAITTIQTTAIVLGGAALGCPDNQAAFTAAQFWLGGHYFNVGAPTPGSSVGDVFAAIYVTRTTGPGGDLRARYQVFQCLDASCGNTSNFGSGDLGALSTFQPVGLSLALDRPNHQFVIQRDSSVVTVPYNVSDTAAPGAPLKAFNIGGAVPNCIVAPPTPRPSALMAVLLGGVFVNPH